MDEAAARSVRAGTGFVDSFCPETRMELDSESAEPALARAPLTVSALNRAVAGLLERSFPLVRVQGELSNLSRAASGHWYFALKDDIAQVRCVMFRGRNSLVDWQPREGDAVEVTAVVSLYEARGDFQLNVESMRRSGLGRLFEEFLKLKQRLAAEGLFDVSGKRTLPRLPRAVGVVTSLQAAALRDVVTALQRRAPYVALVVYPVPVQGADAAARIARMLRYVGQRAEVDVVVLVRGGGSIEDLWAFNEEPVARAIRACPIPVVVGVGHESDFTIADFAADVRAPTPTAAAELVAPAADAVRDEVASQLRHLARQLAARLNVAAQRIDFAQRSLAQPRAPVAALEARVEGLRARASAARVRATGDAMSRLVALRTQWLRVRPLLKLEDLASRSSRLVALGDAVIGASSLRLEPLAARLEALDPGAVLSRGYAIALDSLGHAVTSAHALCAGDRLRLVLSQGRASVQVESVESESPSDGAGAV
jgi:exodeoxyribonuclease VII large subunit